RLRQQAPPATAAFCKSSENEHAVRASADACSSPACPSARGGSRRGSTLPASTSVPGPPYASCSSHGRSGWATSTTGAYTLGYTRKKMSVAGATDGLPNVEAGVCAGTYCVAFRRRVERRVELAGLNSSAAWQEQESEAYKMGRMEQMQVSRSADG